MLDTFGSEEACSLSLHALKLMMRQQQVNRFYVKKLAGNDNSKNQIYFASHLTDVSFLEATRVEVTPTASAKTKDPKRQIKYLLHLDFCWMKPSGVAVPAPNAKLVYYPQYPEVRFSGFLKGAKEIDAKKWMDRYECGTADGRWLIIGIGSNNRTIGYLATPNSRIASELENSSFTDTSSVFWELQERQQKGVVSSRELLLNKLLEIHRKGTIPSQKMSTQTNAPEPYTAQNGGGYTLEAELGILPNGDANPDYLGWEVKQFGIKRLPKVSPDPTTLLTPEPDGGIYISEGLQRFMELYGYPPTNGTPNRINFGGIHVLLKQCKKTNLTLLLQGYDVENARLLDANGYLGLMDTSGQIAASWSFPKLLEHWKRKHAKAVYVPCLKATDTYGNVGYQYGSEVELGIGTTFEHLLKGYTSESIYYDPGINIKNLDTARPKSKKRSQFRVKHKHLDNLYQQYEHVSLV